MILKPKVLLVSSYPPPMGGIERYAQDIMESSLKEHFQIDLFNLNIPESLRPRITTELSTWNIVKRDGFFSTLKVFAVVGKKILKLRQLLKHSDYQGMHVLSTAGYGFFRNVVHILIAKRYKTRTIFHHLGQIDDLYNFSGPLLRRIISWGLNQGDYHVVQSQELAHFLRKITVRPVSYIYNGVKTGLFVPKDGYAHSKDNKVVVVSLGRFGKRKGTFDVIEAAKQLALIRPNVQIVLMGSGEVDQFQKIIVDSGIKNVRLMVSPTDRERLQMLHASDIFLLPSYAEGQPIAILEAMSAGLPIISSTVGSIPEVVLSENGFLVTPGDIETITAHIIALADDPEGRQKMGRHNAQESMQKYDLARVIDEIKVLYLKALNA